MPKRSFVIVVVALSGAFLAGCETSKNCDPLQNLTDAEIERLELEIKNLPEDSVVLKVLEECIFAQK